MIQGAFALCAFVHLLGIIAGDDQFRFFTKPLLIPLLGWWFWVETPGASSRPRFLMLLSLFFAAAGDTLLMFEAPIFFPLGLASFLFMQVGYTVIFNQVVPLRAGYLKQHRWHIGGYALYWGIFLYAVLPGVPSVLMIPVVVYSVFLMLMALSAFNMKGRVTADVQLMTHYGALLFVASDTILALNRFGYPWADAHLGVMITYITGQWLLVAGVAFLLKRPGLI